MSGCEILYRQSKMDLTRETFLLIAIFVVAVLLNISSYNSLCLLPRLGFGVIR